jgi:uncharacterized protein YdeI (BOF family)
MSLSKRSKILLAIVVVGAVVAFAVYQYAMQPPAEIESKEVDFNGTSSAFLTEVQKDFTAWQDKVVVLSGTITARDENGITLSDQIYCQLREDVDKNKIQNLTDIKIKGRVIGYDDLLEELKLDQCIIQQ